MHQQNGGRKTERINYRKSQRTTLKTVWQERAAFTVKTQLTNKKIQSEEMTTNMSSLSETVKICDNLKKEVKEILKETQMNWKEEMKELIKMIKTPEITEEKEIAKKEKEDITMSTRLTVFKKRLSHSCTRRH